MNPKIEKLRTEREKNREKIAVLQARNRELDSRISKLENTEIIGLVRDSGISLEALQDFLHTASDVQANEHTDEKLKEESI